MKNGLVKKMNFWFLVLCILAPHGCGKLGLSPKGALSISLNPQGGMSEEIFWYGVTRKSLEIHKNSQAVEKWDWSNQSKIQVLVDKGDKVRFLGSGEKGDILIFGEVEVGDELTISIPIYRVL